MKKWICLWLIVLLLGALCIAAGAATGEEKAVLATSEKVQQGKTVAISVTLGNCGEIGGYTVELLYDKEIFELAGATWQPQDLPFGTESDVGTFLLEQVQPAGKSPILTFTLQAKAEVPVGTVTEVSCNVTLIAEEGEIPAAVQPVSIRITCPHDFRKNVTSEYLKSPATCTEPAEYYKSCALCGAKDETQSFLSGTALSHNFKDRDNVLYLAEAGDCQNRDIYYVSCVACGLKGEQTFEGRTFGDHVYDSDCDAKCNVCFEQREVAHQALEEWQSNEKGHWHSCAACDAKVGYTKHVAGPEATPEMPQTCTECGYVMKVHEDHTHQFGEQWLSDEEGHWHGCVCNATADWAEHSWEGDTCQVCGAAKATDEPTTPTTTPSVTETKTDSSVLIAVFVLGILLILSLIGNVVLICMMMKKKKRK